MEEGGFYFGDDLAVGLAGFADFNPLGVGGEGFPAGGGFFAAWVFEHVEEGLVFEWAIVYGRPIADAGDAVAGEEGYGVVAEAGEEVGEFAFVAVVDAELEDGGAGGGALGFDGDGGGHGGHSLE